MRSPSTMGGTPCYDGASEPFIGVAASVLRVLERATRCAKLGQCCRLIYPINKTKLCDG